MRSKCLEISRSDSIMRVRKTWSSMTDSYSKRSRAVCIGALVVLCCAGLLGTHQSASPEVCGRALNENLRRVSEMDLKGKKIDEFLELCLLPPGDYRTRSDIGYPSSFMGPVDETDSPSRLEWYTDELHCVVEYDSNMRVCKVSTFSGSPLAGPSIFDNLRSWFP